MIKAVIFDLDDTLYPEMQYVKSGFDHIANEIGNRYHKNSNKLYEELLDEYFQEKTKVFNRVLKSNGIDYCKNDVKELVLSYRDHVPKISFYEDVIPCFMILKKMNINLGIITDGFAISQRQKIKALKLSTWMDEIIITDDLGFTYWKPHSRPFEIMKEKLDVDFSEMVYIGDNPNKDFFIGSIYPITTIKVNRKGLYQFDAYYNEIHPHYQIYSLLDLPNILQSNAIVV